MSTTTDYELSRKYFFYHEDGLLDIFIGIGILLAGAAIWAEMPWMAGAWVAIFTPIWILGRKSITYSRAGEVTAQSGASVRIILALTGMVGLLVLGVLASFAFLQGFERLPAIREFLDRFIHLLVGTGAAGLLVITAALLRLPRFWGYAAVTLLVFLIGHWLGWMFWESLVFSGGLTSLGGCIVLVRFLQTHPVA